MNPGPSRTVCDLAVCAGIALPVLLLIGVLLNAAAALPRYVWNNKR